MPPRRLLPAGRPLAFALTLALAAGAAADTVTLVPEAPGKDHRFGGKVTAESPTELVIGAQKVPVEQIETVTYDGKAGSLMTTGAQRERDGKLAEAAADYQAAVAAAESNAFVAQAAAFARLQVLVQTNPNDALAGLESFAKANTTSRHIGPALELLYRLALAKGDVDRADRAVGLMEKVNAPWAADRAALAKARILIRRNKAADALASLDRMIAATKPDTPKGRAARLAKAEALASQKKYDDAEKLAREAIQAAGTEDAEAQAAAYNTLGDTLRAAGKPKDALLAYLHTDLLYAKDRDEHARALAQIAALWRELKRDDRADEALDRLKHDYPASPWLASAGGGK